MRYIFEATVLILVISLVACGPSEDDENNTTANNTTANNTPANNTTTANNTTNNATTNNTTTNNQTVPSFTLLAATAEFPAGGNPGESAFHVLDTGMDQPLSSTSFGDGDLGISMGTEWAFVTDRNAAQIQILDPSDGLAEVDVLDLSGDGFPNPHFAVDAGGKVYASMYGTGVVAVAEQDGATWTTTEIDLAPVADTDGDADPDAMLVDETYVLVVAQRLTEFMGVENSAIVVIDTSTDTIVDSDPATDGVQALELAHTNAAGIDWLPGRDIAVGATGSYGMNDGAIVRIERSAAGAYSLAEEPIVDEATLGGDLLDFVMIGPGSGFAVVSLEDFSTQLVHFDPSGATPVTEVEEPGFGGLARSSDRAWVVVGDRGATSGFVLLDAAEATVETTLSAGDLPPAGAMFVE